MKKNFKVVQLNGMTGLLLAILAVVIVLSSIIILPVYGIKFLWNNFLSIHDIPTIKLSQSALLWGACLTALFGYLKSKIKFKFVNASSMYNNYNEENYKKIIQQIEKKEQQENEKINR